MLDNHQENNIMIEKMVFQKYDESMKEKKRKKYIK